MTPDNAVRNDVTWAVDVLEQALLAKWKAENGLLVARCALARPSPTRRRPPMADSLLDALREMDAKATKGPWFVVGLPWNDGPPFVNAGNPDPHGGNPVCDLSIQTDHDDGRIESEPRDDEDAALIVSELEATP